MQNEHRSWDAEWADRRNIPEWPMWSALFAASFVLFIVTYLCGALDSIASVDLSAHSKKPEGDSMDSQTANEVEEIRLREIAELRKRIDAMESADRRWYCGHCACRSCSEARRKANER